MLRWSRGPDGVPVLAAVKPGRTGGGQCSGSARLNHNDREHDCWLAVDDSVLGQSVPWVTALSAGLMTGGSTGQRPVCARCIPVPP